MSESPGSLVVSCSAIAMCAILTFSATTLRAQTVPTVSSFSNDARKAGVVSKLSAGARILVATSDGSVFEGRYTRLESQSLMLSSVGRPDAPGIPLSQIDTLWVRIRNHSQGFFVGALTGGLIGAVGISLLAASITRGTSEHCNCAETVVSSVVVSTFLGGVVGAAIGWPGWRRRWPQ